MKLFPWEKKRLPQDIMDQTRKFFHLRLSEQTSKATDLKSTWYKTPDLEDRSSNFHMLYKWLRGNLLAQLESLFVI